MNGTEWTELGQGATIRDLFDSMSGEEGTGQADTHLRVLANPFRFGSQPVRWGYRTNLRLTGHPLTAEDLKRIAEAK